MLGIHSHTYKSSRSADERSGVDAKAPGLPFAPFPLSLPANGFRASDVIFLFFSNFTRILDMVLRFLRVLFQVHARSGVMSKYNWTGLEYRNEFVHSHMTKKDIISMLASVIGTTEEAAEIAAAIERN